MFHLIQAMLKLLLWFDDQLPDNSRLTGSILIGGVWLLMIAEFFPRQLGPWLWLCLWAGYFCLGLAIFLMLRRKVRQWQGKRPNKSFSILSK